jgi:DNA-directed RNA polymerase subunit B
MSEVAKKPPGAPRNSPGGTPAEDAEEAEYAQTLKEWGDSRLRIALILSGRQVLDPAFIVLDSADKLPEQVESLMLVFEILVREENMEAQITFTNASLGTPTANIAGHQQADTPYNARASNRDYIAPLRVTVTLTITAHNPDGTKKVHRTVDENVHIGDVPQVVRSRNCPTSGMSGDELEMMRESAVDPGGYVILRGNRYAIRIMESLIYNRFTVHVRERNKAEQVQGQVISKPGDAYENSAQLVLRVMRNDSITAEISYSEFDDMHMPFYILYRLLGVESDEDLFNYILFDRYDESKETVSLREALRLGMRQLPPSSDWYDAVREKDPALLGAYLGWRAVQHRGANVAWGHFLDATDEPGRQSHLALTNKMVNSYFLPHVGTKPAAFPAKVLHLSYYIRSTLLVLVGVKTPSDRESYAGKRWHAVDVAFAKEIKTTFNLKVARPLRIALTQAMQTMDPSRIHIHTLLAPLVPAKIAANIAQAIVSAERKTDGQDRRPSRMSVERITYKNSLSGVVAVRTVRTPGNTSKQTERADLQRRLHSTYPGSICPLRSADSGEQVGMNKGIPVMTIISGSSSSAVLQQIVSADGGLVSQATVQADLGVVLRRNLTPVLVNGLIVGYTDDAYAFRAKYVLKRLRGEIDPRATIAVDPITGETNFYVDIGRALFPHILVVNNAEEYDAQDTPAGGFSVENPRALRFDQRPALGLDAVQAILSGRAQLDDFESSGKLEYLATEEQMNCLVAPTVEDLARNRHNPMKRYTHLYIHPASLLSLSTLMSPFPTHSQQSRVTYQGQQAKSAQGVTFTNPHEHFESSGIQQQPYVHLPLVSSLGNSLGIPSGQNGVVAVLAAEGENLEDSATVKRQAVQRGFCNLYAYIPFERTLDRSTFGNPLTHGRGVVNIDERANYEHLGPDGIIKEGSPVTNGTVLIGVLEAVADPNNAMQTRADRSVVYRGNETGVVVSVIDPRTSNMRHCKVVVLFPRHAAPGDKISTFSGNKAIICALSEEWEMPYSTADGIRPDVVFNPLSFPSRMVMNQLVEAAQSMICVDRGCTADATAFNSGVTVEMYEQLLDLLKQQVKDSVDPEAEAFSLLGESVAVIEKYSAENDDIRSRFSGLATTAMIDPNTGLRMRGITLTSLFIRRLAKFARVDVYAVGEGRVNNLTKQPAGGKKQHGGMKLGEMEREVLLAQGCMRFFAEKMYDDSSGQTLHVCVRCNQFTGLVNVKAGVWSCPRCGPNADVQSVASDWTTNLLRQTLHCMGIGMRMIPEPIELPCDADEGIATGTAFAVR